MSNNINDTNVELLKEEINSLLDTLKKNNERISEEREYELSKRYINLYTTSKTLFKFIINNGVKHNNQEFLMKTVNLMLDKIKDIQSGKISQDKASGIIGTHVAKEFINVCK